MPKTSAVEENLFFFNGNLNKHSSKNGSIIIADTNKVTVLLATKSCFIFMACTFGSIENPSSK